LILPKQRDPRLIARRRGGTLTDENHRLLALWAAECAERALPLFEGARPGDERPRRAIEAARAWARGEAKMAECRAAAGNANTAARDLRGAPRFAAYAAAQAAVVSHVAAHGLGAAAYALKAAREAALEANPTETGAGEEARRAERDRQRALLPEDIRALVLDDQRLRSGICWNLFD